MKNGIVFEHPNTEWIQKGVSGHVDVVYRKYWGSQYQYLDYYGGAPHKGHKTEIMH